MKRCYRSEDESKDIGAESKDIGADLDIIKASMDGKYSLIHLSVLFGFGL